MSAARRLREVLGDLVAVPESVEVTDLTQDSREVRPGAAFLAVRGRAHHGLEFASAAIAGGARAILWEPAPGVAPPAPSAAVFSAPVPNLTAEVGHIADRFFDAPSAALTVVGITGTNGKTTCAWLLAQALSFCGRAAGYIGTLGSGRPAAMHEGVLTTPDAVSLQRRLAQLRAEGLDSVALEVSSHALDQERVAGVRFQVAALTNLSRDHLDYHADMAAYAAAKAKLFRAATLRARVINVDDAFGAELARAEGARLVLTSQRPSEYLFSASDYVCASEVRAHEGGLELELETSQGGARLVSPLIGEFNVDNLLTALGVLLALGIPLTQACASLGRASAPPGRMQVSGGGPLPLAIVDYAHTPEALTKALQAARSHCRGRLWCVFGCGGERDAGKRALMGQVAAAQADELIITDDNPRREDPELIVQAVLAGVGARERVNVIHDRAAAISAALAQARAGDVVLIAGKGHERYQLVGSERRAFEDQTVVRAALAARAAA